MDSNSFANLKLRYRKIQHNGVRDANDIEDNVYKIDQLKSIRFVLPVWKELPSLIIENFWKPRGSFESVGIGFMMEMVWWRQIQLL